MTDAPKAAHPPLNADARARMSRSTAATRGAQNAGRRIPETSRNATTREIFAFSYGNEVKAANGKI